MKRAVQFPKDESVYRNSERPQGSSVFGIGKDMAVTLLTGGSDRPYVFGLSTELMSKGVSIDLIGSDELNEPAFRDKPRLKFLNLRGDLRPNAGILSKVARVLKYYLRLIFYAGKAEPRIFHILWNNKFETFDRTLLMLYYRFLGKKTVLTVHNVNAAKRDSEDTFINRLTLRIQYRLADHIFVHTEKMKYELIDAFGVQEARVTVIPFGINNSVPNGHLTPREAKRRLGIRENERTLLFFGRITPYKGLEYLIDAFHRVRAQHENYRLIIAGRLDAASGEKYWNTLRERIREAVEEGQIVLRIEYIPDAETEIYFKAADVLVLPYRHIYQSGVLFLSHSFGLPVLAADVGSLKEEIVEGKTGFIFTPEDSNDIARAIERYFSSDLFDDLSSRREAIRNFAMEQHSWHVIGLKTLDIYAELLRTKTRGVLPGRDASGASLSI